MVPAGPPQCHAELVSRIPHRRAGRWRARSADAAEGRRAGQVQRRRTAFAGLGHAGHRAAAGVQGGAGAFRQAVEGGRDPGCRALDHPHPWRARGGGNPDFPRRAEAALGDTHEPLEKALVIGDVVAGRQLQPGGRRLVQRADGLGGRAHDQAVVRKHLVFGNKRVRADKAVAADPDAVEQCRAHADKAVVPDHGAMDDCMVADGAALPDHDRKPGVRVEHRALLHIGTRAYRDPFIVAANDRAEPDADVLAQHHIANDMRIGRDEVSSFGRQLRRNTIEAVDRHGVHSPSLREHPFAAEAKRSSGAAH